MSVLESEACRTLDHAAFKVLAILAAHYNGRNNGSMALTPSFAERFGLKGRNTIYRSLETLQDRGLLVKTRQGLKQKNTFSLYGLGWEDIHVLEGQLLDHPEMRNSSRWLKWKPVPTTGTGSQKVTRDSRVTHASPAAQLQTHHGEGPVPTTGTDDTECVPTMGIRKPICVPMTGNTLRSTGGPRTPTTGAKALPGSISSAGGEP